MAKSLSSERRGPLAHPGASFALASQIFGKPLAMREDAAQLLVQAIARADFDPKAGGSASGALSFLDSAERGATVSDEGVAVLKISGPLLNRSSWFCSYERIAEQCAKLTKESAVKAVLLDIDSGGGMIAGLWEACDAIAELAAKKRTVAVAADHAFSAAYALAACASEVYAGRSGGVGSIGVIQIHQSMERMLDAEGLDFTIMQAGEHKSDGTHLKRLDIGAKAEMMAAIDEDMDAFVALVARERGLSEEGVRSTEARVYSAKAAESAGLIDGVKSLRAVLADLKASAKSGAAPKRGARGASDADVEAGGEACPCDDDKPAAPLKKSTETPMTDTKKAAVEAVDDQALDLDAVKRQAAQAERDRFQAIMGGDRAADAPRLARFLALETGFDPAACAKILEAAGEDLRAVTQAATEVLQAGGQDAAEAGAGDGEADGEEEAEAARKSAAARKLDNGLKRRMAEGAASAQVAPEGRAATRPSLAASVKRAQERRQPFGLPRR